MSVTFPSAHTEQEFAPLSPERIKNTPVTAEKIAEIIKAIKTMPYSLFCISDEPHQYYTILYIV